MKDRVNKEGNMEDYIQWSSRFGIEDIIRNTIGIVYSFSCFWCAPLAYKQLDYGDAYTGHGP